MSIEILRTPIEGSYKDEYERFLESAGLRDEGDADIIAWMTDDYGRPLATGALAGHIVKQLAVSPDAEGQGVMATILTELISEAADQGIFRLFLCTKPANARMFGSLGFYPVIETSDALLMENRRDGAANYIASITGYDGICGAVVCNCNPFTRGHRYLIEQAASNCDNLYVFAVSESGSMISPDERYEMIVRGTEDLSNVHVLRSDFYLVSRATFPAYFIKDKVQAEDVRTDLDVRFFAEKLAPALNITKRFVGEEPLDPVTRSYNENMKKTLPAYGIELIEIPRLEDDGGRVISATRVRDIAANAACNDSELKETICRLVPETTYEIIQRHFTANA